MTFEREEKRVGGKREESSEIGYKVVVEKK